MPRQLSANLTSFGVFLLVFAFVRGPFFFWSEQTLHIFPSGTWVSVAGISLIVAGLVLNGGYSNALFTSPFGYAVGIICYLLSDAPTRAYSFFQAPSVRGEFLLLMLAAPLLFRFKIRRILELYLALGIAVIIFGFLKELGGSVIFSDDHPSVFYRLSLLKAMFPAIPFYNPQWNAGVEARDFFSTGILNFFLLYFPVIKFFNLEDTYNLLVILTVAVGLPLSAYFGVVVLGLRRESGLVAAILVLGSSLTWYRWLLKYGTMGFATSAVLALFVFCFLCRFGLCGDIRPRRILLGVSILFTCLMLTWTPIWFVFVPLGIFLLFHLRRLLAERWFRWFVGLVVLVTVPWLIIWLRVANVLSYVTEPQQQSGATAVVESGDGEAKAVVATNDDSTVKKDRRKYGGRARDLTAKNVFKELRSFAVGMNPLLFILGIAGIIGLTPRHLRWLFGVTALWLLLLGSVVSLAKPHLELERLLVVLGLLMSIPVGNFIAGMLLALEGAGTGSLNRKAAIPVMSCLLLTPIVSASVVRNRTLEQFTLRPAVYDAMKKLIQREGGDGRVVYSGFVLHELGGGHIAPLALDVSNPLVAISFVHDHWRYQGVVPHEYLDAGPQAVEEYFDYLNATAVFAHERFWRNYFEERPDVYSYAGEAGKFKLYRRKGGRGSYILKGEGTIDSQGLGVISVTPRSSELVIKFKYIPALISSGCAIEPYKLPGELYLIKLTGCTPNNPVTISRRKGW